MARLCDQAMMAWCKGPAMHFREGHEGLDWARCGTYEGNFCHFAYKRVHEPESEAPLVKEQLARYLTGFVSGARGGKISGDEGAYIWQSILGYPGVPWEEGGNGIIVEAESPEGGAGLGPPSYLEVPGGGGPLPIPSEDGGISFLFKPIAGGVKTWHILLIGGVGVALVALMARK